MRPDPHNFQRRLECMIWNIQKDPFISENNKKAIIEFHKFCFAEGLSIGRVLRYLFDLKNLNKFLGKDFELATRKDIEQLLVNIEKSHYAERTKRDFRIALRKFYKWLRGTEDFPEEVRWFKVKEPKDIIRLPEEMLTEEDITKLIDAADNPRDKAFVAIIYESGCRIGEMLFLRLKHIKFDDYGAQLLVEGKTGFRRVRIITSVPYLTQWLNNHPKKSDPEAPLWISMRRNEHTNYPTYRRMLNVLKKNSGITKKVNPHNFRHSRATYLANYLTEAQMKEYFGWKKDSEMAAVYVHLSGRDVDKALLRTHGIKMEETPEEKSLLEPKQCKRCKDVNPSTNQFCRICGLSLEDKLAEEIIVNELKRKEADEVLDRLMKDEEFREVLMKKLRDR